MKVIYLTNNKNAMGLCKWLKEQGEDIILIQQRISLSRVQEIRPDIIVSYNYSYIIKKDVIDFMKGNIVNLHISMLPWNRGTSPNFWSFMEDTPKGVTIHYINEGLDTGDIILQKEVFFEEKKETFESTYGVLSMEIQKLFRLNWNKIRSKELIGIPQKENIGTSHTMADLDRVQKKLDFTWSDNIYDVKEKYLRIKMSEKQR